MIKELELFLDFIAKCVLSGAICVACTLAGFNAGKSNVFERVLNDKIECSLTVNPITQEQLK
jgi:hypothetical protein